MEWIKVSVATKSESVEDVLGVFLIHGITGAEIVDNTEMKRFIESNPFGWDYVDESLLDSDGNAAHIVFYVRNDRSGREQIEQIERALRNGSVLQPQTKDKETPDLKSELVEDSAWLDEWKKFYKPFRIGKSTVVVPHWEEYAPDNGEIIFKIDPGSVFGTGLHPTTKLCVEALDEYLAPRDKLLDIGCGSGILSVIALLMGAGLVVACDFERAAAESTIKNAGLNGFDSSRITVKAGDIFDRSFRDGLLNGYGVVVANIVADTIIKLFPIVYNLLARGGIFVASGILVERARDVVGAAECNGFEPLKTYESEGWVCAAYRRAG